jgi:hypothetical protein
MLHFIYVIAADFNLKIDGTNAAGIFAKMKREMPDLERGDIAFASCAAGQFLHQMRALEWRLRDGQGGMIAEAKKKKKGKAAAPAGPAVDADGRVRVVRLPGESRQEALDRTCREAFGVPAP